MSKALPEDGEHCIFTSDETSKQWRHLETDNFWTKFGGSDYSV